MDEISEISQLSVALMVKNVPANAGDLRDVGLIPRSGRSPGEENGNPLQYTCLENPMVEGSLTNTVHVDYDKETMDYLRIFSVHVEGSSNTQYLDYFNSNDPHFCTEINNSCRLPYYHLELLHL